MWLVHTSRIAYGDHPSQWIDLGSPVNRMPIGVPGVGLHGTKDERVPYEQPQTFVTDRSRHFEYLDVTGSVWAATGGEDSAG